MACSSGNKKRKTTVFPAKCPMCQFPLEGSSAPWLLLGGFKDQGTRRGFYNLGKLEKIQIDVPEEMGGRRRCFGSTSGWIVTHTCPKKVKAISMNLVNPFSRTSISLPKLPSQQHSLVAPSTTFITKAILTASPDSPDCILFAIHDDMKKSEQLAFMKPGVDTDWSVFEDAPPADTVSGAYPQGDSLRTDWNDVIRFDGNLYGCLGDGRVFVLDLPSRKPIQFAPSPSPAIQQQLFNLKYLVDLGGELCLIVRYIDYADSDTVEDFYGTHEFEIYKVDVSSKEWTKVLSLGNRCLFLGTNYTFALEVETPSRFKAGCIYFTDDMCRFYNVSRGCDMGIWNHDEKSLIYTRAPPCFESMNAFPLPRSLKEEEMDSKFCPAVWITPSLN